MPSRFAPSSPAPRTWVCPRCRVRQVDVGWPRCANCELPRHRWIAHPPPGGPSPKVAPPAEPPYTGPPSYQGRPPRWAFPPVVWQENGTAPVERRPTDPSGMLRVAAVLAAVAAVLALAAAAAETWRFALLLEGRVKVLPAATVWGSDVFVAATGAAAVAAAIAALLVSAVALVRTHPVAALRLGRAPSRSRVAVLARLLVPGWNLYGAGQIVTEIDRHLTAKATDGPARASRLTVCWWLSWIVSAALISAALVRGLGGSLQAIADTVELHIAVDLAAAVCAGLGAAMLWRFGRLLRGRAVIPAGWVVGEPPPTRG